MNLQKRLASKIMKVGRNKVWLDPTKTEEIRKAITRADIRRLIKKGYIKTLPDKVSKQKQKKKKRRYAGSKKGKKHSLITKKESWMKTVRPLRELLRELKNKGKIDNQTYRKTRALVKGGMFRSKAHLLFYLKQRGLLKGVGK